MTLRKMSILICAILVLGMSAQAFATVVDMKSYTGPGAPQAQNYVYRIYNQVPGSSYELHVGTEDPDIGNYTFTCDEVVGTLTSATIEVGDSESHNSTVLPGGVSNPSYTVVFSADGSCPYYMKFTWTAAGSGRGHITANHPAAPHPVGMTLSGADTFNEDWSKGLGGDGKGPGYGPTPEPATIALLGLGGLALIRKRR